LILFLLLAGLISTAEEPLSVIGRTSLRCAVCDEVFETVGVVQANSRGGVDRDLFSRALGPNPVYYRIATCPYCGYSGYPHDFNPELDLSATFQQRVRRELDPRLPDTFTPKSDPRELDASIRYDLAIQCYQWRNLSHEAMAWLNLRASWVARDKGSVLPPDDRLERVIEFVSQWKPRFLPGDNQADLELKLAARVGEEVVTGRFNRYQKPYVELAMAMVLRRHGEYRVAQPILERIPDEASTSGVDLSDPLQAGIDRMIASIERERQYQREAARHFEEALTRNEIRAPNRAPALYLLGELHRRLGHEQEAIQWFHRALADDTLPEGLRAWTLEQRAWTETALVQDAAEPSVPQ
jgi:uncharacterized protein (DUF2225 family)